MAYDNEQYQHKEWLGLLQPEGLVVSPPALSDLDAFVDKEKARELQPLLQGLVEQGRLPGQQQENILKGDQTWVEQFSAFAETILEWETEDFTQADDLPEELAVDLPNYGETLRPDYGVEDPDSDSWLLLVKTVPLGVELDKDSGNETGWAATYQQKFERLLKGMQVPIGILWNGVQLRLVYAPSGESSGHVTFPIEAMTEVPGRPILGALDMLLGADRLFNAPTAKTLPKLLETSRNYQANVSTKLAEQVLDALWELLRGFQAGFDYAQPSGEGMQRFRALAKEKPQHVYGGLLTTLMRLVFLLYAEDQGLMPDDAVYQGNYSVAGLYEKLREDAGQYPDTMDQRYGAWAWLLSLFRLVYDGGGSYEAYLPARHGQLFDPKEYPFLEGSSSPQPPSPQGREGGGGIPRIADGVVYRILEKLLILEGERLSYRALDVEQIGSVYEAIMGYEVEVAEAQSIAVRPKDVVINLETLLAASPKDRAKVLKEEGELKLTGKAATALKKAKTIDELLAALERRISGRTAQVLMPGALYLQPGEERRRTGSHYTPRKLTQPIVETTLRPIFERLGDRPTAEEILELKVCDLAMGSAAFLVEACRQLAAKLVEAWDTHGMPEDVPEAVEPLLYARRLVAQRCLYGVDKNPFAVNLAKLSLWLVTLARDLPFTFVDHSLKCGDSLVGLTRAEIGAFGENAVYAPDLFENHKLQIKQSTQKALILRQEIQKADTQTDADAGEKSKLLANAEEVLEPTRLAAKMAVASFFLGENKKQRKGNREEFGGKLIGYENGSVSAESIQTIVKSLAENDKPITPFNWEVEFPEVFDRKNPGFDAIIGNPPFLGGKRISTSYGDEYFAWIKEAYPESTSADLVAFFFRRAFTITRPNGAWGLIATNTIAQGDTRSTGLRFICQNGGTIYNAQKRVKWPGLAAVVVSVVNVFKGAYQGVKTLDDQALDTITAFLFHAGGHENPKALAENVNKSFVGSYVLGMGFTFDDTAPEATTLAEMQRLIAENPRNQERIFPYIGGSEVNSSPIHAHHRYVINFGEMSEEEAREWPDLMTIVEEKVYPERKSKPGSYSKQWWLFGRRNQNGTRAIATCDRVLVIPRVTQHASFAFLPTGMVYSEQLIIFALNTYSAFCSLQSRLHETWSRFFASSLEDRLRYTPSDCFETFPFPNNWQTDPTLETIGQTYYQFRADLMVRNNQGLTDTYNRFHAPQETDPEILKLRELHTQMDCAVLDAYGWTDIAVDEQGRIPCGFALDYLDIDEDKLPTVAKDRINRSDLYFPTATEAAAFDNLVQSGLKKRKKLPWRYRWPETTHDEVLARLLDLNQQRHEEEIRGGLHKKSSKSKKPKTSKTKKKSAPDTDPGQPNQEQLNLL
ncbi:N-6 DNA Methylase [Leptolyngbya sp. PCC 7375]|nr:N-6 DNA Methylase [Leptolyngbya sp. PCC 7375]